MWFIAVGMIKNVLKMLFTIIGSYSKIAFELNIVVVEHEICPRPNQPSHTCAWRNCIGKAMYVCSCMYEKNANSVAHSFH